MNRFSFVIFLYIIVTHLQAQQSLNLRAGVDIAGLGFGYRFAQNGNVLKRGGEGYYGGNIAYHIGLQYTLKRTFALEFGMTFTEYDLGVHDVQYLKRNNLSTTPDNGLVSSHAYPGWLGAYRYYYGPKVALYEHVPIGGGFNVYFVQGMMMNYIMNGSPYVNSYSSGNEVETLTTTFKSFFPTGYLESGIQYNKGKKGFTIYCGIKYIYGGNIMQSTYTDISNNVMINTDHVTANASYVAFTFHLGGTLWHTTHNLHKKVKYHDTNYKHTTAPITKSVIPPVNQKDTYLPQANRTIKVTHTIQVHAAAISIEVWDHEKIDGDVLTLTLNGKPVLDNYTLTLEKHVVDLNLSPGDNILVMTAINQGQYKPCTAAIRIYDGTTSQTYILDADFATSGSLVLQYNP